MTAYYTTPCSFCEHPIKKGQETKGVFTEWSHSDKNVCRENIRADERERNAEMNRIVGRDFLADLRAKVEGLPKAKVAGVLYAQDDVLDRDEVLALIKEAQP